uniref:Anti-Mullerian hormone n=1 Tax=Neogobius melanostomus TaxID=47308 RepID=A0A8C6SVL8_9GOBI
TTIMNMIVCGVLMLGLSSLSASLQVSQHQGDIDAKEETRDAIKNLSSNAALLIHPHNAPCFVDDILATLRESLEENGQLRHNSLAQFGVCTDNSLMFMQLATQASNNGFGALYPTEVLVKMEEDKKVLTLTFDSPESPQMMLKPVLILSIESMIKTSGISFTSPLLNPNIQIPCTSEETQYILLTGTEGHFSQIWKIIMSQTTSPDTGKMKLCSSDHSLVRAFVFVPQSKASMEEVQSAFSDLSHNSFLCELKHFLVQSSPQDHDAPVVNLESLQSMPSQPIGLSSSESLLAALINSSAPTILSFTQRSMLHAHREELALTPALLAELRQRLEQTLADVLELIKENGRARMRLQRLKQLSGFPFSQSVQGTLQYRAFLLFKVLQTASHALNTPRSQRSTRDHSSRAPRNVCGLTSLSVSLQQYVIAPTMATINNCQGSCTFPMIQGTNHVVLLNSHIASGNTNTRAPCCVPVAYDPLEVVKVEEKETSLEIEPNMVATKCECR